MWSDIWSMEQLWQNGFICSAPDKVFDEESFQFVSKVFFLFFFFVFLFLFNYFLSLFYF